MLEITGKVIEGKKYGRTIGYPTANLECRSGEIPEDLKPGIYAGLVRREKVNTVYKAGIVVNPFLFDLSLEQKRPERSVGQKTSLDKLRVPKIEVYLIDFHENIYGENLTLDFREFIRDYRSFSSEKDLVEQIKKDIENILRCFD